jgi:hypothetical protein
MSLPLDGPSVFLLLLFCCWTGLVVKLTLVLKAVCPSFATARLQPEPLRLLDKGTQCNFDARWHPKIEDMTVQALRHELSQAGFESVGVKQELVDRLRFVLNLV